MGTPNPTKPVSTNFGGTAVPSSLSEQYTFYYLETQIAVLGCNKFIPTRFFGADFPTNLSEQYTFYNLMAPISILDI